MSATIDLLNANVNNVKKVRSVSCAVIEPAVMTAAKHGVAAEGTIAVGDVVQLFNLPKDCVIVDAYIVVEEAATEATATLEIKSGTDSLIKAIAAGSTAGAVIGIFNGKKVTGTGAMVTCTVGTAALKSGKFSVVVAYDEITRNANGDFTPVHKKL